MFLITFPFASSSKITNQLNFHVIVTWLAGTISPAVITPSFRTEGPRLKSLFGALFLIALVLRLLIPFGILWKYLVKTSRQHHVLENTHRLRKKIVSGESIGLI
jgi:glycopeptide antibiotics resistance protein